MSEITLAQGQKTPEPKVPTDFCTALGRDAKAKAQWADLTPISRRDFITWIESAKQEKTRLRRIEVACSKLASGQKRPCCYAVIPMGLYRALDTNTNAKAYWKELTPNERRDFANWIDSAKTSDAQKQRIVEACALLATEKKLT